jgi:hypothetical protein
MKIIAAFAVGLALGVVLPAVSAQAQNARSFVSGHGLDSNACTLAAPCRTFQHAHDMTNASGEIDVLDRAGYGPVTINKAISIVNDGSIASVLVPSGGVGITINAMATDAISLRGLTIEGAGVGTTGIRFNSGKYLAVENCVIRHLNGNGIEFFPSAASSFSASGSLVADNVFDGILVTPFGTSDIKVIFDHVRTNNNGNAGILVSASGTTGALNATASDSVAFNNGGPGFSAVSTASNPKVNFHVFRSVSTSNGTGVAGDANGLLVVSESLVSLNTNGYSATASGFVVSYGDNDLWYNNSNIGVLTKGISKQ